MSPTRVYDPETGRFPSRDPLDTYILLSGHSPNDSSAIFEGGIPGAMLLARRTQLLQKYVFVDNSPVLLVDPVGLYCCVTDFTIIDTGYIKYPPAQPGQTYPYPLRNWAGGSINFVGIVAAGKNKGKLYYESTVLFKVLVKLSDGSDPEDCSFVREWKNEIIAENNIVKKDPYGIEIPLKAIVVGKTIEIYDNPGIIFVGRRAVGLELTSDWRLTVKDKTGRIPESWIDYRLAIYNTILAKSSGIEEKGKKTSEPCPLSIKEAFGCDVNRIVNVPEYGK
ncbi:MAG: hypothetical protein M5U26_27450 [Planctomycetota bacterium]|nr:hypothetical protein [Planctomycetota bacterium]